MNLRNINKILHPSYQIPGTEEEDTDLRNVDKKDLRDAAREWINFYNERLDKRRKELSNLKVLSVSTDSSIYHKEITNDNIIIDENVVKWIKYFFDLND
jgi:hypothetical protein